jgi:Yip1 domain
MSERGALTDSGAGRVLGALAAPADTFRSIAARPTWLAPLLVMMLLATVVTSMVSARIDMAQLIRHQLEATGSQPSLEQIDQRIETMKKFQPYLALLQGLVAAPAVYLVCALLFWVAFKLLGSDLSYKASFATTLHGLLPLGMVQALLAIPVIWNRASFTQDEARSGSFLASNLAAIAPDGVGPVARALLGSVDLFSIWSVLLLVVGYRIVARVSRGAALGVVLSLWLLGVALKAALVAISPG